jgi:hypothetical protein
MKHAFTIDVNFFDIAGPFFVEAPDRDAAVAKLESILDELESELQDVFNRTLAPLAEQETDGEPSLATVRAHIFTGDPDADDHWIADYRNGAGPEDDDVFDPFA